MAAKKLIIQQNRNIFGLASHYWCQCFMFILRLYGWKSFIYFNG